MYQEFMDKATSWLTAIGATDTLMDWQKEDGYFQGVIQTNRPGVTAEITLFPPSVATDGNDCYVKLSEPIKHCGRYTRKLNFHGENDCPEEDFCRLMSHLAVLTMKVSAPTQEASESKSEAPAGEITQGSEPKKWTWIFSTREFKYYKRDGKYAKQNKKTQKSEIINPWQKGDMRLINLYT